MTKQIEDHDDRHRNVARDGERVTVPLLMMDAATTAQIDRIINDAQMPLLMHRPGFVKLGDADRLKRETLYRNHEKDLTERWKQTNHSEAAQSTGDTRVNAYAHYEQRLTSAWRHR